MLSASAVAFLRSAAVRWHYQPLRQDGRPLFTGSTTGDWFSARTKIAFNTLLKAHGLDVRSV
jgi:hypothetical protein